MPSAQKRPRSPETGGMKKRRRRNAAGPLPKRRSRGAKDERISVFMELQCRNRQSTFADLPPSQTSTAIDMQETTDAACTGVNSRQLSSLHDNGDLITSTNDDSASMNTANTPKSGSRAPGHPSSRLRRNNRAALHQTYHLDALHSPWETHRNNQARQWQAIVIPQIIPAFLKNRAATESGRSPPPPQSRMGCQCTTTELEVDIVTWDRTFLFCTCGRHLTYSRRTLLDCIIDL